jgi:hypothetical protein
MTIKLQMATVRTYIGEALVYGTESESEAGITHYTFRTGSGELVCSCRGWQFRRECKHTRAFVLEPEALRVLQRWAGLTPNQVFVLTQLTKGTATARDPVWWPLRYDQVRGILRRLRIAGYVEIGGYRRSAHVYRITETGHSALQAVQPTTTEGAPTWQ